MAWSRVVTEKENSRQMCGLRELSDIQGERREGISQE